MRSFDYPVGEVTVCWECADMFLSDEGRDYTLQRVLERQQLKHSRKQEGLVAMEVGRVEFSPSYKSDPVLPLPKKVELLGLDGMSVVVCESVAEPSLPCPAWEYLEAADSGFGWRYNSQPIDFDALGAEGWELVSAYAHEGSRYAVFKRRVVDG